MCKLIFISLAMIAINYAGVVRAADEPAEFWTDPGQGWVVETKPCTDGLCGYLVDFPAAHRTLPNGPQKDTHNPDPQKRSQPLCGLPLMGGFRQSSSDNRVWKDGWVYDPQSGSTYSATATKIDPDTLSLRGYIGITLLGRTFNLHRVAGVPAGCSATG